MNRLRLILLATCFYTACAYSDSSFLCDIYQGDKKLTSQRATLPDREFVGWAKKNPEAYANNVLVPSLCQTVGLGNGGEFQTVTGMRPITRVKQFQQYASPECTLQCKLVSS